MPHDVPAQLDHAAAIVPPGKWGVGVSGGADSVALLRLLAARSDLQVHVIHLDHQTRAGASAEDAQFVQALCTRLGAPCTIATREQIEQTSSDWPTNRSARFRALRHALFRHACAQHGLAGGILAHHALDQAETIFQRLVRNSGPAGLEGMKPAAQLAGLTFLRPLLAIWPDDLRAYLAAIGQDWREDASNASPAYQRNRVRSVLKRHVGVADAMNDLAAAMSELNAWVRPAAPVLAERFAVEVLADCPEILAQHAARQWLTNQGVPVEEALPAVVSRLIEMARDAASSPRQHFPTGLRVRRRGGWIEARRG